MKHITLLTLAALSLCACRTERDKDDSWKTYNSQNQTKSPSSMKDSTHSPMNNSTATTAGSASGTVKSEPENVASKTTSNTASSSGKLSGTQADTKKAGSTVQPGAGAGPADNRFIENAIRGGMFEIRSSRLALQKVMSGPTRDFAEMMVEDHDKANRELEDWARTLGGTIPTTLDAAQQEQLDQLAKLEGKEFERAYHEAQVKAHDGAINLFEKAAKDCESNALKTYATTTLTTLREHRRKLDETPVGS